MARKTGFDRFLHEQMRDRSFARGMRRARQEVDAVDQIIRALDESRIDLRISKAELARSISAKPEIVRRLLTAKSPNPTLATVVKIAAALRLRVQLDAAIASEARRTASRSDEATKSNTDSLRPHAVLRSCTSSGKGVT
jgi:hypothetical protein